MRIQTLSECVDWLEVHKFQFDEPNVSAGRGGFVYLPVEGHRRLFHAPADGWTQTLLSYQLTKWVGAFEALLWITDWSLYEQKEMELFDSYRQLHEEHRRLIDTPGYLLDTSQEADAWVLTENIHLMLSFNWQGFVMRSDKSAIIWLADGMIETFTGSHEQDEYLQKIADACGIVSQ